MTHTIYTRHGFGNTKKLQLHWCTKWMMDLMELFFAILSPNSWFMLILQQQMVHFFSDCRYVFHCTRHWGTWCVSSANRSRRPKAVFSNRCSLQKNMNEDEWRPCSLDWWVSMCFDNALNASPVWSMEDDLGWSTKLRGNADEVETATVGTAGPAVEWWREPVQSSLCH